MASRLVNRDAYELMATLEDGSVDLVITDPPYGTTDNGWDSEPDWVRLTSELRRVLKPHGIACIFAQVPVSVSLISAAWDWFSYELVWVKNCPQGFLHAKYKPLRKHEVVNVFCDGIKSATYNPQFIRGGVSPRPPRRDRKNAVNYGQGGGYVDKPASNGDGYPVDVLDFDRDADGWHPTQKPVDLLRWLVRTYSNPGGLVLDPFGGSGSTAVACHREGRDFVGSELNPDYFAKAKDRIDQEESQLALFDLHLIPT